MARPDFIVKKDRRMFDAALTNAAKVCTSEAIAHLEELRLQALEAVYQLQTASMKYANEIGASDLLCRAFQGARSLELVLSMAKANAINMQSDIDAALKISDKSAQENVERVVHEATKKAKKEYDKKRYQQKKEEAKK